MKNGYSMKLALSNIRKHRRLFVPYMLAGAGLVAVFFIVSTLTGDTRLADVKGGEYIRSFMGIGVMMTALLAIVLIFYINSFLMKQRKREFGIYNILGMEKKHVNRIVFCESVISALISIAGGLIFGMLMYKLCVLFICKMLGVETVLGFYYISFKTFKPVLLLFGAIYLAAMLFNMLQITRLKPIELLKSSKVGEKEPKIKWLLLLVGLGTMGAGYYISITTKNPLSAIMLFFVAVFLVIIGTYCLFTAGSIALLKLLKKNKNYYYKKRHMVAVSGLLYRMKQNAVGLASISILSTCVLVMISSTFCLYAGTEDGINRMYATDVSVYAKPYRMENGARVYEEMPAEDLVEIIEQAATECGLEIKDLTVRKYFSVTYYYKEGTFITNQNLVYNIDALGDSLYEAAFMTADEYKKVTGEDLKLKAGEIAYCRMNSEANKLDTFFTLADMEMQAVKEISGYPYPLYEPLLRNCYGIVLATEEEYRAVYENQFIEYRTPTVQTYDVAFNFVNWRQALDKDDAATTIFWNKIYDYRTTEDGYDWNGLWDSRVDASEEYYAMNGTLFFLGIILTVVFMFGTTLIIYYKQISEGYDDRDRFQIMQKVGMSNEEVKGAIKTQVLLMFFLPLIVAGAHMAGAFPIIYRLLGVLFVSNLTLFVGCAIGAYLVFIVIYVVIYILTTKVYYHIVH